jgi:hypothetical protein
MNAGEPLREGQLPSQASQEQDVKEPVLQQEAGRTNADRTLAPAGQGTWRSEGVMSGLEKALNALVKAQDHLHTAADQGGESVSKMIDGINRNLRGLQRELSQVIYRLGTGG